LARRKLLHAVKALQEKGTQPPGVDPQTHKVRSASFLLPKNQNYSDAAQEYLQAHPGKPHESL
ncbi:MAG: aromatic ring-hydroxylating dioxygenase subunit alpha, partial [Gammaproteobacteria bacterium]|nr:aromatic ring-hydroxylating dioxygenase subunit alpha [Gammaproteobacteria bacterium]